MKKIFTLLMLMMFTMTSWAAKGDVYEIILNGSNVVRLNGVALEDPSTFFTYNSAKHNFNTKFKGCSYAGIQFTKGLKMEGATLVQWIATADAKVTILQSSWSDKTIKFDDEELDPNAGELIEGGILYAPIENVPAGTHTITRGSGETGLFYVRIDYTSDEKERLADPEVTADKAGKVTISAVENAKEIRYTIDGTKPSAENGEIYTEPFTVEDGTVVNALAIGEGNYVNSNTVSLLVLVDGITVAAPVINQINGTFIATSETTNAAIEISYDQQNWVDGSRAQTLTETKTVYARATRENCTTSDVTSVEVTVYKAPTNTEKIYFFYDDPEDVTMWSACNENVMEGNYGTAFEGYSMAISGNSSKNWSNGEKLIVPGIKAGDMVFPGDSVTSLKLSNGAQNTITLADGKKAVRLTFYSYVNAAKAAAAVSGWQEVNGSEYDYKSVPMTSFSDQTRTVQLDSLNDAKETVYYTKEVKDIAGNLDVRVFDLNYVEETITFTNKGTQLAFVAVVEIATENTEVDPAIADGIHEVKAATSESVRYNLAGQKVADTFRGMVIKNGKKFMQK